MCKRDTVSVKVAPESVLSNRGISNVRTRTDFRRGGYLRGGLSPGGNLRTSSSSLLLKAPSDHRDTSPGRIAQIRLCLHHIFVSLEYNYFDLKLI